MLGAGKTYFRNIDEQVGLKLVDIKKFASGSALLTYRIAEPANSHAGGA